MFSLSRFNGLRTVCVCVCVCVHPETLQTLPSSAEAYMSHCVWHCATPSGMLPARAERTLRDVSEGLYSSID